MSNAEPVPDEPELPEWSVTAPEKPTEPDELFNPVLPKTLVPLNVLVADVDTATPGNLWLLSSVQELVLCKSHLNVVFPLDRSIQILAVNPPWSWLWPSDAKVVVPVKPNVFAWP
jgi:hypothetical protein